MKESVMIKQIQNRDEEAFEYCYEKYKNLIYFEVYRIIKDHLLAEELLQDTFLKMYQAIDTFDGRFFTAWLVTIAKNLAINEYKRKHEDLPFIEESFDPKVVNEFYLDDIYSDLALILTPIEYETFIYIVVYNVKLKDISELQKIPVSSIHFNYMKALKKAKEYFNKEPNSHEH